MNAALKQRFKKLLPFRLVAFLSAVRWWRFVERAKVQSGMRDISRRVMTFCGTTVLHGPFKGLKFTREGLLTVCNTAALLGTYEMELHPQIEELCSEKFDRILDIGAAEGYYAVGMALRTGARVDAYDTAPKARRLCRSMAKLNGVSSLVHTHSLCSQRMLLKLEGLRCFILSDCEGFEVTLFSDNVIRALANCDLIIELHDGAAPPGTTREILKPRFAATHIVDVVENKPRNLQDFSELSFLAQLGDDAQRAISEEGRGSQEWLIATPLPVTASEAALETPFALRSME
jgi:hypothetical protein